ncbi:MAG TPA: TonB-dependent receptor, partial [Steroidobacteraceae bacterium]|nr:TonB-dependent receptor [Steroidobacteraceae bacterium]
TAAFGNLNYHFMPQWTLGVGLRYTQDRKNANFTQSVNAPLGFESDYIAFPDARRDDKQVSGDVTLTWKPRDGLLGYATVRKGFKSGGFQTDIIDFSDPAQFNFKPETAVTYELGVKSEIAHRLRLNGAVFDTEYKDMQVSQLVGLGFTTNNAGKSRIRGVELELDYVPVERLTLGLSGGWLDAKYLQFPNCDSLGLGQNCSGNRLQFTPEWNLGATVDYRQPLPFGSLVFHADSSSRGDEYSDAVNSDGVRLLNNGEASWPLKIGGYTLVGGRFGFETPDRAFGVYLWGKNLTNKDYDLRRWRYPITPAAFGALGAQGIEFVPGQPRTWGVELTYRH